MSDPFSLLPDQRREPDPFSLLPDQRQPSPFDLLPDQRRVTPDDIERSKIITANERAEAEAPPSGLAANIAEQFTQAPEQIDVPYSEDVRRGRDIRQAAEVVGGTLGGSLADVATARAIGLGPETPNFDRLVEGTTTDIVQGAVTGIGGLASTALRPADTTRDRQTGRSVLPTDMPNSPMGLQPTALGLPGTERPRYFDPITRRTTSDVDRTSISDDINRALNEAETEALNRSRTAGGQLAGRTVRGAARSLTQVAATAPLGPGAVIGGFAATTTNDAITEGYDAGLRGPDLVDYAFTQGAIEGTVTSAFNAAGLGGLESGFSQAAADAIRRGIAQHVSRQVFAELVEELTIAASQQTARVLQNVDPNALSPEKVHRVATDTVLQTIVAMGLMEGQHAPSLIRARNQLREQERNERLIAAANRQYEEEQARQRALQEAAAAQQQSEEAAKYEGAARPRTRNPIAEAVLQAAETVTTPEPAPTPTTPEGPNLDVSDIQDRTLEAIIIERQEIERQIQDAAEVAEQQGLTREEVDQIISAEIDQEGTAYERVLAAIRALGVAGQTRVNERQVRPAIQEAETGSQDERAWNQIRQEASRRGIVIQGRSKQDIIEDLQILDEIEDSLILPVSADDIVRAVNDSGGLQYLIDDKGQVHFPTDLVNVYEALQVLRNGKPTRQFKGKGFNFVRVEYDPSRPISEQLQTEVRQLADTLFENFGETKAPFIGLPQDSIQERDEEVIRILTEIANGQYQGPIETTRSALTRERLIRQRDRELQGQPQSISITVSDTYQQPTVFASDLEPGDTVVAILPETGESVSFQVTQTGEAITLESDKYTATVPIDERIPLHSLDSRFAEASAFDDSFEFSRAVGGRRSSKGKTIDAVSNHAEARRLAISWGLTMERFTELSDANPNIEDLKAALLKELRREQRTQEIINQTMEGKSLAPYTFTPAPITGRKSFSIQELMQELERRFRITVWTTKFRNQGVFAKYLTRVMGIITKRPNDLRNAAHELGHYLDDRFTLFKNFNLGNPADLAIFQELVPVFSNSGTAPFGNLAPTAKAIHLVREGFSEWMLLYIINPAEAQSMAPRTYAMMQGKVDNGFMGELNSYSESVRVYFGQTSAAKAAAAIQGIRQKRPTITNGVDHALYNYINRRRPIEQAVEEVRARYKRAGIELRMKPTEDPVIQATELLGVVGVLQGIIQSGMIDKNAQVATEGNYDWLIMNREEDKQFLEEFNGDHIEMLDAISQYALSRRVAYLSARNAQRLQDLIDIVQDLVNKAVAQRSQSRRELMDQRRELRRRFRELESFIADPSTIATPTSSNGTALTIFDAIKETARIEDRIAQLDNAIESARRKIKQESIAIDLQTALIDAKKVGDTARATQVAQVIAWAQNNAIPTAFSNAATRNAALKKAAQTVDNLNRNMTASGLGVEDSSRIAQEHIIDAATNPKKHAVLEEGFRRLEQWADRVLRYYVDSGFKTEEDYQRIKESNEVYASMMTIDQDGIAFAHEVKGSLQIKQNQYIAVMMQTMASIVQAHRNDALRALYDVLVPARAVYGKPELGLSDIAVPVDVSQDNTVTIYRNGKKEFLLVKDPLLLRSLSTMSNSVDLGILRAVAAATRFTRSWITLWPDFWIRQAVRDPVSRATMSTMDRGNNLRMIASIWNNVLDRFTDEEKRLYLVSGAGYSTFISQGGNNQYDFSEMIEESVGGKPTIFSTITRLTKKMESIALGIETRNRRVAYRQAYNKAMEVYGDEAEARAYAAWHARNVIDFALGGGHPTMRQLNQLIMFLNAAIQSSKLQINRLTNSGYLPDLDVEGPSQRSAVLKRIAMLRIAPVAAIIAFALLSSDEEERKEIYNETDVNKAIFIEFKLGGLTFRIPTIHDFAPVQWATREAVERIIALIMGDDRRRSVNPWTDIQRTARAGVGVTLSTTSPLGLSELALVTPEFEVAANFDAWRGAPIARDRNVLYEQRRDRPSFQRASELSKAVTDAANYMGAADAIGADPRILDFYINSRLGTAGRFITELSNTGRHGEPGADLAYNVGRNVIGVLAPDNILAERNVSLAYNLAYATESAQRAGMARFIETLNAYNTAPRSRRAELAPVIRDLADAIIRYYDTNGSLEGISL